MNAKELRAAAQRSMDSYRAGQDGEPAHETVRRVYGTDDIYEAEKIAHADMVACFEQVLATVRDDDDEAVTVEWYRESGFRNSFVDPSSIMIAGTVIVDHDTLDATVCNGKPKLKTRGDVRKLCEALGIELKEPQQ